MALFNMLMEAVVLAFMLGGIVGAAFALHLHRLKPAAQRVDNREDQGDPAWQPIRTRRRPPR